MKSPKRRSATKPSRKKRYQPPQFVIYGDLRKLTKVKLGAMGDGVMKPATKAGGANA